MLDKTKINKYGLLGLILVSVMLILNILLVQVPQDNTSNPFLYRFTQTVLNPYILISIIPYVIASIVIDRRLDSHTYTKKRLAEKDRFNLQNIFIGIQIAMVLWIVGLLLGLDNLLIQLVYYVVALGIGLMIPTLLFSKREQDEDTKKDELEF